MNVHGMSGTKKLAGKLLAVFSAVALLASSFLLSAVWATADTGDYHLLVDFDDYALTANNNETYAVVQDGSPLSGNYLQFNRGQSGVASGNGVFAQLNFAANEQAASDEALVFYVKASSAASLIVYLNDVDGSGRCMKVASGQEFYLIGKDGTKTTATTGNGVYAFGQGFEGWAVIPAAAYSVNHWGGATGLTLKPGTVSGIYMGCSGAWGSVFSIDNIGFTADIDNFVEKAAAGTPVAIAPGGETGGDEPVEEYAYNIALDFDTAAGSFSSIGDYTGTDTSVAVADGNGYAGKALHANRGTSGNGNGGGYNFELDFTPTGDATDNAFVFYLDTTLSKGITAGTVLGQPIRIYDKGGANGATRCFKLPVGAAYSFVSADGTVTAMTVASNYTNSQIAVTIGSVGWYVIPFSSFEMQWGGVAGDTVAAGGVFRWATGNGGNWGNYYCFDNVGFAADAEAFAAAAAAGKLADGSTGGDDPDQPGEGGGEEPDDPDQPGEGGGETTSAPNLIAQGFEGTVAMPDSAAGMWEIVDSDNGKALKLIRGNEAVAIKSVPFDVKGAAEHVALAFWYDATNTGFADGISFSLIPRNADGYGTTLAKGYPVTTVIDGVVTKDDTSIMSSNFTVKPKAGTKGWIIIEIPKAGSENKMWAYDGGTYTGDMQNMAFVELGIPYFTNSSIVLDEFTLVGDVDGFIASGCKGEAPDQPGEGGGEEPDDPDQPGEGGGETTSAPNLIAQGFEGTVAMPDSAAGMWEIVDSDNGKALKLIRGNEAVAIKSVPFDVKGAAEHVALAFWYDATNTGFADGISFSLIPRNADGYGTTLAKGYPVTTVIDGVVTKDDTGIMSGNFTVKPKAGTKGWIIIEIPKAGSENKMWAYDGGTYTGDMQNMAFVELGIPYFTNSSIVLDEFTLVGDVDGFIASGCKGEAPDQPGEGGGEEPDDPDQPGEGGGEDPDQPGEGGDEPDAPIEYAETVVAQGFEGTVTMPEGTEGMWEIVDSDNGKALRLIRGTEAITLKSVLFDEVGKVGHTALAFWYDATSTGFDNGISFSLIPRTGAAEGGITLANKYPVTTVIDGVVTKDTEEIVSSNFTIKPKAGTKGWIIIEIPKKGSESKMWSFDGDNAYTGTVENMAAVQLGIPYFNNSSMILDEFTLVGDVDAFIESIGGEEDDPYVPDLSNPSPSDYNLTVDFDTKEPTEIKHEGGGFAEESTKHAFEGEALWWDRGMDQNVTSAYVTFEPTGYSDENALVFWWNGEEISSSHNVQVLVYAKNAAGETICMKPKSGGVYRTVKDDGTVQDKIVAASGMIMCEKNFSGWIVIPFAAMGNHWSNAEEIIKPGTVYQVMFQHTNTYGNQIFIDNIGMTHNVDNFAEKVADKTLNQGGRVEPGVNVLPLPDGAGVSDKNLSGGADGATADNDYFRTVVNFNSKVPVGLNEQNTYVKLVKESVSGYGSAMNWFKNDNTLASNLTISMESGAAGEAGIAFWISTKDSGNGFATKIRLMPHDKKDGTERCWRLIQGGMIYFIQDGIVSEAAIDTAQMLTVPGGFEGWVVLPYDVFEHHWGVAKGDDDAAVAEYTIDPATVYILDLYYGNQSVTKAIQIDEIGFFTDALAFVQTMGVIPEKPVYDLPFQFMESTYGEGGTADAPGKGVLAWTDSKGTLLEINGDYYSDGYSLLADAKAGAQIHICIDGGEEYGVTDKSKMAAFTGIAFWVYTETGSTFEVALKLADGKTVKLDAKDLSTDFYRLVDENTFDTVACAYKDGKITVPADFQGWVVIDTCAYAAGDWNLSALEEIVLGVADDSVLYLDMFRTGTSATALLVNSMNFPMDDDLILSADGKKLVIEETEDGGKVINLYQSGLTSGQFRELAIVRAGYRVVYRDIQNRQLFGSVADMKNVAVIRVYLGSVQQAEYALAIDGVLPTPDGGNSPSTGDSTQLWVYVLAAAMVGIIASLALYNRKAAEE